MEISQLTVLVVGCGLMGGGATSSYPSHARAVSQTQGLTLIAGVDVNPQARQRFAAEYGVKTFSTVHEAIGETQPDVVLVATGPAAHVQVVAEVLELTKHLKALVVEKPIATRVDDFEKLLTLSKLHRVPIFVNHSRRFSGFLSTLPNEYFPKLGDLISVEGTYYGGWLNNGTHMVDLIHLLCKELPTGNPPARVTGERPESIRFDGRLSSGARVTIQPLLADFQIFEAALTFTKGRVLLKRFCKEIVVEQAARNAAGEMVLQQVKSASLDDDGDILCLMSCIVSFCNGEGSKMLASVEISQIAPVMEFMFWANEESGDSVSESL